MQKISLYNKNIFPNFCDLHGLYHQNLRNLLIELKYLEVWCPPISSSPCFETHVHPFELYSCKKQKKIGLYLHTSPEFILKNYLCQNTLNSYNGIFNLNYVFRDDVVGSIHRRQFVMLEFYRTSSPIEKLIDDLSFLIHQSSKFLSEKYEILKITKVHEVTVNELFENILKFSILDFLKTEDLYKKICKDFPHNAPCNILPWDDLYNLLWLNYIEPSLKEHNALLVKDFPAPVGLLATSHPSDPRVKQRFELFIKGFEIANGYAEETSYPINNESMDFHLNEKKNIYQYSIEKPNFFLNNLKQNGMTASYGVAVGTERLLQVLTGLNSAFIDME